MSKPLPAATTASFDVFDTLLTRLVGRPEDVFVLVGQHLERDGLITMRPAEFAQLRQSAERAAREHALGRECRLDEIYAELGWRAGWDNAQLTGAIAKELSVEREVSTLVPAGKRALDACVAAGMAPVFVSDTYLSREFVCQLLRGAGIPAAVEQCFVSCEHRASKRTGALFIEVMKYLGVAAEQLVHYGNSQPIDIAGAARAGIRAHHLDEANLTRYEREAAQVEGEMGRPAWWAGAMRSGRLESATSADGQGLLRLAAGVTAPVLTAYVKWVLRRAKEQGLRRLYFVSRDGQILHRIATELERHWEVGVELRYLHGGRLAWGIAGTPDEHLLDWVFTPSSSLSVENLFRRVQSAPEEFEGALSAAALSRTTWRTPLRADALAMCRDALLAAGFADRALAQARLARHLVRRYLLQEGILPNPSEMGLVDIGWRGTLANAFCNLLAEDSREVSPGATFFFGSLADAATSKRARVHGYLFDQSAGRGYVAAGRRAALMAEAFCAADHGSVLGYEDRGNVITPVLSAKEDAVAVRWGVRSVHDAAARVARAVAQRERVGDEHDDRELVRALLDLAWMSPSADDARSWGAYPLADDPAGDAVLTFASPYGWRHVWQQVRFGAADLPHPCAWPAASELCSTPAVRTGLAAARRVRPWLVAAKAAVGARRQR